MVICIYFNMTADTHWNFGNNSCFCFQYVTNNRKLCDRDLYSFLPTIYRCKIIHRKFVWDCLRITHISWNDMMITSNTVLLANSKFGEKKVQHKH